MHDHVLLHIVMDQDNIPLKKLVEKNLERNLKTGSKMLFGACRPK